MSTRTANSNGDIRMAICLKHNKIQKKNALHISMTRYKSEKNDTVKTKLFFFHNHISQV